MKKGFARSDLDVAKSTYGRVCVGSIWPGSVPMGSSAKKAFIPGGRKISRKQASRWKRAQRKWNGRRTESGKKENGKRRGSGNGEMVADVMRADEGRVGTISEDEESTDGGASQGISPSVPSVLRKDNPDG